ncbi:hypothetical protein E2C01_066114 [Portunus trituberculatus]|uniref:Uncharacterized protein n=1 Tax=Portunus trituberculatus TaxID=210409 RepID=A0A5B7HTM4_PORTR|nr:hypothetical protein [Portunus trituberculatus]
MENTLYLINLEALEVTVMPDAHHGLPETGGWSILSGTQALSGRGGGGGGEGRGTVCTTGPSKQIGPPAAHGTGRFPGRCAAGGMGIGAGAGGGEVMMTSITVGLHGRTVSGPRLHGGA